MVIIKASKNIGRLWVTVGQSLEEPGNTSRFVLLDRTPDKIVIDPKSIIGKTVDEALQLCRESGDHKAIQ